MRAATIMSVLALGWVWSAAAAGAAPMFRAAEAEGRPAIVAVAGCPPGTRYVPAGYDRKGKWRDARCVGKK
jgi:phage tail tape-measure protein